MSSVVVYVGVSGASNPGLHSCGLLVLREGETHRRWSPLGLTTTPKAWALALQRAIDAVAPWEQAVIHLRDQGLVRAVERGQEYPADYEPSRRAVQEVHRRGLVVRWVDGQSREAQAAHALAGGGL